MEYILIRTADGPALSRAAACALVRYTRRRLGRPDWQAVCIEQFCGGAAGSLLLARPSCGIEVQLAPYVLPLLRKYH